MSACHVTIISESTAAEIREEHRPIVEWLESDGIHWTVATNPNKVIGAMMFPWEKEHDPVGRYSKMISELGHLFVRGGEIWNSESQSWIEWDDLHERGSWKFEIKKIRRFWIPFSTYHE